MKEGNNQDPVSEQTSHSMTACSITPVCFSSIDVKAGPGIDSLLPSTFPTFADLSSCMKDGKDGDGGRCAQSVVRCGNSMPCLLRSQQMVWLCFNGPASVCVCLQGSCLTNWMQRWSSSWPGRGSSSFSLPKRPALCSPQQPAMLPKPRPPILTVRY